MKGNLLRASSGGFCHLDADEKKKWKNEEADGIEKTITYYVCILYV